MSHLVLRHSSRPYRTLMSMGNCSPITTVLTVGYSSHLQRWHSLAVVGLISILVSCKVIRTMCCLMRSLAQCSRLPQRRPVLFDQHCKSVSATVIYYTAML